MKSDNGQYQMTIRFSTREGLHLKQRASKARMSMSSYVRMLVEKDWGDYRTKEQEALDWILSGPSTDRVTE